MIKKQSPSFAFTLIELLVVVAIISLLVSILMPSLKSAKELARTAVCMNNSKGFGSVFYLYASDYGDLFPPTSKGPDRPILGEADRDNWMGLLNSEYLGSQGDPCGYFALKGPSIWLCPSDMRPVHPTFGGVNHGTYGVNAFVTGYVFNPGYWSGPAKLSDISDSSRVPLLGDTQGWACTFPGRLTWGSPPVSGYQFFPHYHQESDIFLFVDGSVNKVPGLDVAGDPWGTYYSYCEASNYFAAGSYWR